METTRAAESPASPLRANCSGRRSPLGGGAGQAPAAQGSDDNARALPTSSIPGSASFALVAPNERMMGTPGVRRGLEWLLGLYFLSHVPITLLLDLQAVLPRELYPFEVRAPVGPGRQWPSLRPLRVLRLCPGVPMAFLSLPPSLGPAGDPAPPYPSTRGFCLSQTFPPSCREQNTVHCKNTLSPGVFKALTPHL